MNDSRQAWYYFVGYISFGFAFYVANRYFAFAEMKILASLSRLILVPMGLCFFMLFISIFNWKRQERRMIEND